MRALSIFISIIALLTFGCKPKEKLTLAALQEKEANFDWNRATVYFLMTDRFYNGDKSNDFLAPVLAAPLRGFMGGDVAGITQKIEEGYFTDLGVDAIWMTPLFENIAEGVDEGTGLSYGFHGYWIRDWTAYDKRIGTKADIKKMVDAAHAKGIKVLFDVVLNHTGPVTLTDTKWPDDWVRTSPKCTYSDYRSTTSCTLVENLPDILTSSERSVELPPHLVTKWKKEGRYDQEIAELNSFFKRTGYPRAPKYYIIKWLTDLISDFGIDGYRVDTAKHLEEEVWSMLRKEADYTHGLNQKNQANVNQKKIPFYMVAEVYNYYASGGLDFNFGDKKVNYYDYGFDAMINFDFKGAAKGSYQQLFDKYHIYTNSILKGKGLVNYISSHDDGDPYDAARTKTYESTNKLMLAQGQAQIYYGDESGRKLDAEAAGDAKLRSFMNWSDLKGANKNLYQHWQKLGLFRQNHPSIALGLHHNIQSSPYIFARKYDEKGMSDQVVVGLDQPKGVKTITIGEVFEEGTDLLDYYSNKKVKVVNSTVTLDTPYDIVLLQKVK